MKKLNLTKLTKTEEKILDLVRGHPVSISDISRELNKNIIKKEIKKHKQQIFELEHKLKNIKNKNYKIVHECCSNLNKKLAVDLIPEGKKIIVCRKTDKDNYILKILKDIEKRGGEISKEEYSKIIYDNLNKKLDDKLIDRTGIDIYLRKFSKYLEESIKITPKGRKILKKYKNKIIS